MTKAEKFSEMAMDAKSAINDFNDFADDQAISWAYDKIKNLTEALRPFANYACDAPCGCHNCTAKAALEI